MLTGVVSAHENNSWQSRGLIKTFCVGADSDAPHIFALGGFADGFYFYDPNPINPKQMKTTLKKPVAIVGYSGHAYVIIDILLNAGRLVTAYCDNEEKEFNPYHLTYLGKRYTPLHVIILK